MKLFGIIIKLNVFKLNRNNNIYKKKLNNYHSTNYSYLVNLLNKKSNTSNEIYSLHSLLTTVSEYNYDKLKYINKTNSDLLDNDEYNIILEKWRKCIKIYISWFPEINEDKYKSKCFSLPSSMTFHIVIPNNDINLYNILETYDNFNFHKILENMHNGINENSDSSNYKSEEYNIYSNIRNKNIENNHYENNSQKIRTDASGKENLHEVTNNLDKININENKNNSKNTSKRKKDENIPNCIEYSIKKEINLYKIENLRNVSSGNNNEIKFNNSYCSNNEDLIFFFSFNLYDLKNNEEFKEILSECLQGNFVKKHTNCFNPFLFIVYDFKTLIHILNNIELKLMNIDNVFDIYIISSLLQLVQRGEKLQTVFSAYLNDQLNFKHSKNSTQLINFSHFSIFPPEFSDVLSGKYGIYGWGKYQKMKEKSNKKKKNLENINENELNCTDNIKDKMNKYTNLVKYQKKNILNRDKHNQFRFIPIDIKNLNNIKKMAFGNKRSMYEITEEDMISYCISRNCCLIILFDFLIKKFEENLNLLNIYIKIEQPLILCISEIEKRGIFLNEKKIEEIQKNSVDPLIYKKEIENLCNCDINLNSSKQVSSLLYKYLLNLTFNNDNSDKEIEYDQRTKCEIKKIQNDEKVPYITNYENSVFDYTNEETNENDCDKNSDMKKKNIHLNDKLMENIINSNYSNPTPITSLSTLSSSPTSNIIEENASYFNNTINEMKKSKNFLTNNKMLKIIVDEIEKCDSINGKEKEKIKKIISNIKLYRESKKLFQNYIENLPKYIQKNTKKIHCNFNQIGASTGRLSCDQPNLQNIHSRFRCAISLKKENGLNEYNFLEINKKNLIAFDYRQMELFVMAYLSFDVELLKLLNYNDVFIETAKLLFNTNNVTNELRRMTKTVIYGILYGQTESGLAKSLLISDTLANKLIQNFFNFFPNVYKFMQMQKYLVKHMDCVYTLIGRKRIILPNIKNKYRISMNSPIQGCAADIMKFSLLSCFNILSHDIYSNPRLLKINDITTLPNDNPNFLKITKLILQVHDELLLESEQEATNYIVHLLKPVLENAFYNLIHYTNSFNRLQLLFDYMHDNISIKTYIEYLEKVNNQTYKINQYEQNNLSSNLSSCDNEIFSNYNFKLPIKVEFGAHYKESS
ncbi:DNA polymerase 1, putative [Plasmodium gallinaceum]|uniref:DNA polymerase 1, putative n=1 Tax=Plasmodium gallinaceum TaxID=5849 RepID=A0A1J1GN74_PLAGA|nr:DNA polymerase 1, putative [Plasmodium gallinaceum]CRG93829.1 DNA polymerase 1, putative [Plasmodium gallinaceum]